MTPKDHKLDWIRRNPEKAKAHNKLKYMVHKGKVVRPNSCSICGKAGRVEGHHEDYSKPLDVIWLCRKCHAKITKAIHGEEHHRARFTEDDVREIRRMHESGMGARRIGKIYGCDPTTVARIFRRETWKHVK